MSTIDLTTLPTPASVSVTSPELAQTFQPRAGAAEAPVHLPDYLVRFYDWAYLWPISVWFFDHQPIIRHQRRMKANSAGSPHTYFAFRFPLDCSSSAIRSVSIRK